MKSNHEVRYAAHPHDFKTYCTSRIREEFLVENLFQESEINLVYSHYDRMIIGGLLVVEKLVLESMSVQKTSHFLDRREMGIINIGGRGEVVADDVSYELNYLDALYLGKKTFGIQCPAIPMNCGWKHTCTLTSALMSRFATSWDNRRKPGTFGCKMKMLYYHHHGRYIPQQELQITVLFGEWQAQIVIWILLRKTI